MPGKRRSTSCGDCPDDILEGAVVLVGMVSTVSAALNMLFVLVTELGSNCSCGGTDVAPVIEKFGLLTEYMGLGAGELRSETVRQETADGVAMAY